MRKIIKKILPVLLASLFVACGNPAENICKVYEDGTEDVKGADTMEELDAIRADVAGQIDEIVVSNRHEVNGIISGEDRDLEMIKRLKDAQNEYISAMSKRIQEIYPPSVQLLDVYVNGTKLALEATDAEALAKIGQETAVDAARLSKEYKISIERASGNDRQRIAAAEKEFNAAMDRRHKELLAD